MHVLIVSNTACSIIWPCAPGELIHALIKFTVRTSRSERIDVIDTQKSHANNSALINQLLSRHYYAYLGRFLLPSNFQSVRVFFFHMVSSPFLKPAGKLFGPTRKAHHWLFTQGPVDTATHLGAKCLALVGLGGSFWGQVAWLWPRIESSIRAEVFCSYSTDSTL